MKNKICIVLSFLLLFIMTGCGNNEAKNGVESTLLQTEEQTEQSTDYEQVDEELWTALLDHATVYTKDDIRFTFKAGNEVKVTG
ncbi:MAG: hypothetical protein OSJ61_20965 [Lachnospiraceae bacterium]|nr:hypothetical protein [Lachnospiraceae bacterium]